MTNIKGLSNQTCTDVVVDGRTDVLTFQYTFLNNYRSRKKVIYFLLAAKHEND